jgi:hypothetical protein
VSKGTREAVADWLMVLASPLLLLSLFLTWSHQFSASLLSSYGAAAVLQGIPRDPNAWQVYSAADVLLAMVAAGLLGVALRGGRTARLVVALCVAVALAFTLHALSVPPTNGANLFDPALTAADHTANSPTAGAGETAAVIALAAGFGGLLLSFTAD